MGVDNGEDDVGISEVLGRAEVETVGVSEVFVVSEEGTVVGKAGLDSAEDISKHGQQAGS